MLLRIGQMHLAKIAAAGAHRALDLHHRAHGRMPAQLSQMRWDFEHGSKTAHDTSVGRGFPAYSHENLNLEKNEMAHRAALKAARVVALHIE
jgi:hypothetical protein